MKGSRIIEVNKSISIGCITEEAKNLIDDIMEAWVEHEQQLKKLKPNYEPGYYALVYWLVRWSRLIQRADNGD